MDAIGVPDRRENWNEAGTENEIRREEIETEEEIKLESEHKTGSESKIEVESEIQTEAASNSGNDTQPAPKKSLAFHCAFVGLAVSVFVFQLDATALGIALPVSNNTLKTRSRQI
jgi:hypothetical protein